MQDYRCEECDYFDYDEETDTYECIATIMQFGIDDASVAFTADNSVHFLHLLNDDDFAYSSGKILSSILQCHVTQSSCR